MPEHSDPLDTRELGVTSVRDAAAHRKPTSYAKGQMPTWYLWYFAVMAFTLVTLSASLALNYSQSNSFRSAVDAHAVSATLLSRIAEVRTLAIAVNAPGNDVFGSRDYVLESQRLDVAAAQFRAAYENLLTEARIELSASQSADLQQHIPRIETGMARMLNEARQIMSFLARDDADSAGRRMAAMDREYADMMGHITAMEMVIRKRQQEALTDQRLLTDIVRSRSTWLAVAALLMVVATGIYGYRIVLAIRREAVQRRRYTRRLARARDQAEHAAKIKSQFLANMSHEIRTPMNGVLGMLDALTVTPMSAQQAHMLKTANDSAGLLLSIIDDILDFSKIEAGMLVIERVPLDLHDVVQRVVSLYNVRAREKRIELRYELPEQLPSLLGDPTRMTQLLSNFVSNAIKFTSTGAVTVRVEVLQQSHDALRIRCSVQDNGIGIAPDVQRRLFTPFTQADGSTSRRFGGTGLGLAICKQLVSMLDREQGEIGVHSVPGEGATFFFILGLTKSNQPAHSATQARRALPVMRFAGRVLLAEDNETNQQVALTLLRSLGLEPVLAVNGREAVERAANERFDLILMDYHMPELDGHGATLAIRQDEQRRKLSRTPIVAVTASVLREDKDRCEAAGMDDFLAKPIRQHSLATMLAKWLPNHAPSKTEAATQPTVNKLPDEPIDRDQFDEMRHISGDGFAALLDQFHSSVRDQLESLRAALQAKDALALKRAAHKLKGTTATLGAKNLAVRCLELETMGAAEEFDGVAEKIEQLATAYLLIRARFEQLAPHTVAATG
jgi:signal transduction histidine kinase/HPt (histidine-containing phosphotransfer) domain-containing protein/DNA-binding NarL/FixJ family response regulator